MPVLIKKEQEAWPTRNLPQSRPLDRPATIRAYRRQARGRFRAVGSGRATRTWVKPTRRHQGQKTVVDDQAPLKDQVWDLTWKLRLSARYHQKRERLLDGIDRFTQCVGVLGGAGAFSQVFVQGAAGTPIVWWNWLPSATVACVSAAALCYGPGAKARRHAELARDNMRLHAEVVRCGSPNFEQVTRYRAEMLVIESGEPGSLRCLVRQCENELNEADGNPQEIKAMDFWERRLMHVLDVDPSMTWGGNIREFGAKTPPVSR